MIAANAEPRRASFTLVLATLVTLLAVVPLGVLAWQARSDAQQISDGLTVTTDGVTEALSAVELEAGAPVVLVVDVPDLVGASWAMFHVDGDEVAGGATTGAAPLVLHQASEAIERLDAGLYDLLVTATLTDGATTERAARFEIGDAQ